MVSVQVSFMDASPTGVCPVTPQTVLALSNAFCEADHRERRPIAAPDVSYGTSPAGNSRRGTGYRLFRLERAGN